MTALWIVLALVLAVVAGGYLMMGTPGAPAKKSCGSCPHAKNNPTPW